MDTFTTVLSVFSTVCAIVFGYIAFVRNRDTFRLRICRYREIGLSGVFSCMKLSFFYTASDSVIRRL